MNLANITSSQFKQILALLEEKEALQSQVDLINTKLASIGSTENTPAASSTPTVVTKPAAPGKSKRSPEARAKMAAAQRARWAKKKGVSSVAIVAAPGGTRSVPMQQPKHSPLGESIVSILKSAGKAGISVIDVASKLRSKYTNIYVWFVTTGKKINGIKKVGPAKYAWVG